ncbi:MAG: allantoicase [Betaproteobacteria bacterium]|nr:allantoicase [Betaproteobacteria bacterium]
MTFTINAPQDFVARWINLAQPRLGAEAVFATDEFFASKDRMLSPEPAMFIPGKYDEHGKWMDGWETRRRRGGGYDSSIVRLGHPGIIKGVDIDTSHFTGNYPPAASVDACYSTDRVPDDKAEWGTLIPATNLKGNSHHYISVDDERTWTHVRLNIFPDGGVARLRVYGQVQCNWEQKDRSAVYDLSAMENGGRAIAWNDAHFGMAENLTAPGRGVNMGDGWETRRRREPGNDWCIIALGHRGAIEEIVVDTAHFKGNYPDRCAIQAADVTGGTEESLVTQSMFWPVLLPEQKLEMDAIHAFRSEVRKIGPVTHVRLNIYPDGGVSRLRLFGRIA